MRIRHWLLTGTSFGLLSLASLGTATAQDVNGAYQAYVAAQASGDADALAAAEAALRDECIVAGFQNIDECVAAGGSAPAPAEQAAPEQQPAPEEPAMQEFAPEQPAMEEPAPQEPAAEQPAPEEPVAEEPVTEEPAPQEPVVEEPAPPEPMAEEPAVEQPAPEQPAVEQPAPEEPVAEEPAMEQPAMEEAAPEQPAVEQPAPQEPAAEQPAPQQPEPEQPAPEQPTAEISSQLQAEIDTYNGAIADMMGGGDAAASQSTIASSRANIEALCASAGFASVDECLAANGLSLPNVPNLPGAPAEQPAPQAPAEQSAPQEPAPQQPPVDPATLPAEPVEQIDTLPQGVTQEEVAPLLDSAKDAEAQHAQPQPEAAPGQEPAPQQPAPDAQAQPQPQPVAPPVSDAEAQAEVQQPTEIVPLGQEQGEQITAQEAAPQPQLPPNVQVVDQTNNNLVFQIGAQFFINNVFQDNERIAYDQEETYYERLPGGRVRETVERTDGTQIVTIRDRNGNILRRSRITPDGREYILAYFDDRYENDLIEYRDPGRDLPPLRLNIPARDYVLDSSLADENELELFFSQPPVEQVARLYSIDEVKRSARVRDSVRRLEVGNLTFDSGAATVSRDQVATLSEVATAMQTLLQRNPAETFLIEGHTDAVGSDLSNLSLSDSRAATVARILTDFYGIPPENLATQGYGERYLKINTTVAERLNRRVTIRRITPLITPMASN